MGESSTCLVRSFSTPSDTICGAQEGNPLRALGESISFGRFMSENLDWEKWSAFSSHKRYVEEAEKYSKPGSVAAKKAYFEAHYKKKAAEKAAALIQEENAQANGTFNSETQEGNCTHSSIETANEQLDKDGVNYQVVDCADTNQHKCDVGQSDLDISNVEGAEDVPHSHVDTNINVESCTHVDNSNHLDHVTVHENVVNPVEERMPDHGTAGQEILALPVKGREVNSSPKLSTKTKDARVSHSLDKRKGTAAIPPRNGINNGLKGKKSVGDAVEKKRLSAQSLHTPSGTGEMSKTAATAVPPRNVINNGLKGNKSVVDTVEKKRLSARSLHTPSGTGEMSKTAATAVPPRNVINNGLKGNKSVVDTVEKKRLSARSLHMSINLPSGTGETSKTAAAALPPRNGINRFSTSKKSDGGSVEKKRISAPSLHMSINLPSGPSVASKTASAVVKPRNRMDFASKIMKSVGDSVKRSTARSLHMSINLTSGAGETSKIASVFENNRTKKIHSNLPKDQSVASRISSKASHDLLNQASANPPSQGRRTERLLNKSVSGGVTVNEKLSSLSVNGLKSSSTTKRNLRSSTISSPFRFKSEERAIKRKEFLQRMDETKSKKEEKFQLQRIPKGKTEHDHKKQQQSSKSKSKPNEDRPNGSQPPSNQIRKSSLTLPQSPKPGSKASSSTVQDKNLRNSWKPPISTNNSKRITEKNNRTTRQSGASLSNITRENASPNIQH